MVREVIEQLAPREDGHYVDATVGGGGHSQAILDAAPGARLLCSDRDPDALLRARVRLGEPDRVVYRHAPFSGLEPVLPTGWAGKIDGVLVDLGISSDQLADRDRGFSFQEDGPLDMRMDPTGQKRSAAKLLAEATQGQLERWLFEYGEERRARRIAGAIVEARRRGPLLRTSQLADLVHRIIPRRGRTDPATRTFQALRIAVNRELDELELFLERAPRLLAPGGSLLFITFHSLEDRLVKRAIRSLVRDEGWAALGGKGLVPDGNEVARNPRSRSARLRGVRRPDEVSA